MKYRFPMSMGILMSVATGSLAPLALAQRASHDLAEFSLEDLMNIEVITASKKQQKLSQTPAAVFAITQEDIRRSGMTNIPDLLRMVPGVQVAQAQAGQWAVSARGFNGTYSNKLLVLVDGRSVYSPIDSGVFWDEQNLFLENIERIEVIRGPGATLWGSNAVNGVINIITKTASETQGALATAGTGNQGRREAAVRLGGAAGSKGHYRISTKYSRGASLEAPSDRSAIGGQRLLTASMRADWALSSRDSLTVHGSVFHSSSGIRLNASLLAPDLRPDLNVESSGVNLAANWSRTESERSKSELRIFFSHPERSEALWGNSYSIIDVDFNRERPISESHDLIWGVGFRDSALHTSGSRYASFSPPSRNDALFSGFVEDQWAVLHDRLYLILGSKFEHNDFGGVEIQPGARVLWTPDSRHTLWAAVARSVREPSMVETNLRANRPDSVAPNGMPIHLRYFGDPSVRSEGALTEELGYRLQARQRFSLDVAAHHTLYTHLRTFEPGDPVLALDPRPSLTVDTRFANLMRGEAYGVEVASNWKLTERWRLAPSYSWLRLAMRPDGGSKDQVTGKSVEGQSPSHQFQVRSNLDLSTKVQLDGAAYFNGALPHYAIRAYTRLDVRLGYRPRPDLELSLSGQNLQGGRHAEFDSATSYARATIGRGVLLKLTWGF
jgi:iron complex outermembrane receptor protein